LKERYIFESDWHSHDKTSFSPNSYPFFTIKPPLESNNYALQPTIFSAKLKVAINNLILKMVPTTRVPRTEERVLNVLIIEFMGFNAKSKEYKSLQQAAITTLVDFLSLPEPDIDRLQYTASTPGITGQELPLGNQR
jgi:hypothetical protein